MGKGGALVVKTVLQCCRNQYCRIRFYELKQQCFTSRFLLLSATLLYCNTVFWSCAEARDFGIHGKIAPIDEHDPIVLIQSKLKAMEENGEFKRHNLELQKKTRAAIERPKPVEGLSKATKGRVFYYDPTYVVQEDIKDHQGLIIHPKGTRINPLETVSLYQGLLFFDGDDEEQVAFAKEKLKDTPLRLILTKGAPLALSEEFKIPVYFDQSGLLAKKLRIHHVPALVTQNLPSGDRPEGGLRLRIEEIKREEQK
jgi:conjugal transfer pilus assembly protein TraW